MRQVVNVGNSLVAAWLCGIVTMLLGAIPAEAHEPKNGAIEITPKDGAIEITPNDQFNLSVRVWEPGSGPNVYMIGVACKPQEDGKGVLVAEVFPGSPAEKAGIKKGDVLFQAGDKGLDGIKDLLEMVGQTKGKKLAIQLLRGDEKKKIQVTPEKRGALKPTGKMNAESLRLWIDKQGTEHGWPPIHIREMHPGMIVPPHAMKRPGLPEGVSVAITKQGDNPAKIVVERGEKRWEVTEDKLDPLPEDLRESVKRMLGRDVCIHGIPNRVIEPHSIPMSDFPIRNYSPLPPRHTDRDKVDERLDRIEKQIDKLFDLLNDRDKPVEKKSVEKKSVEKKPEKKAPERKTKQAPTA